MTTIKLRHSLLLITLATGVLAGCELIVDFDRTTIPVALLDSGTVFDGAALTDAQGVLDVQQVPQNEASAPEAGSEGGADAGTDTGPADAKSDG